jgi:hypothetical protein
MDRRARACRLAVAAALTFCAVCYAATPQPQPRPAAPANVRPAAAAPNAAPPPFAPPPPATSPATHPAADAIPPQMLQEMYRRELGNRYNPADAARLEAVHQLVEQYFDATTGAQRKAIAGQISATGVDPNIVGRLTRIRTYWPPLEGGSVYYVNERFGPTPIKYFFGVPKNYDRTKPWPLVIKLPAAETLVTEPPPDGDQVASIYTGWIKDELDHHPDAVVMMPLLHLGELYGPSFAGMNMVMQPMQHVAGRVNVDPARVYMLGHSMAAHAVWNLGLHYPTYFAAINPLAGGASAEWQRLRVVNLRNTLPVVWHDADDQVIKVASSRAIVRALRTQKVNVEYEETKKLGHAPDAATADRQYDKLRARVRDLYPPEVSLQSNRMETQFNRIDWIQVWQPINPGQEHRLLFRRGTGHMLVYDNTWRIDATHKANRIDITAQNVDSFRLYLNDQMVDFSKPITIVVNKKGIYEGPIRPSVEEMLKDQLFLGRGWRYFTGVIDIDVVKHPEFKPPTRPAARPAATASAGATTGPTTRKGRIIVGPSDD